MQEGSRGPGLRGPAIFACVSVASVGTYLWLRVDLGRTIQLSFANICANVQMKPQDWVCRVSLGRSIALYLAASFLVWLGLAIPCAVLSSTGRRITAFAPLAVMGALPLAWAVRAWSTVSQSDRPAIPYLGGLDFGSMLGGGTRGQLHGTFGILADLVLVGLPALFVPVRRIREHASGRSPRVARGIALGLCAVLCLPIVWAAAQMHLVPNSTNWLSMTHDWASPVAMMFVFGALLGTTRRFWPWIFAPVAILLSLGPSEALLGAISRFEAFGGVGAAVPYAAVGLVASLWRPLGDLMLTRSRAPSEQPREPSHRRLRPGVALNAAAVGLLGVTLVMHAFDPLEAQIQTLLPTYLGVRTAVEDLRARMNLHQALDAMNTYARESGTFTGFDARRGSALDPSLSWRDTLRSDDVGLHSLEVAVTSGSDTRAELATISSSGTAFCLRQDLGAGPTYGSASSEEPGTTRSGAIAAATASCADSRFTADALTPYPIDSMCVGQGDETIVICRAVQRLLRRTIASPR
jgi:hypothetical protein